MAERSLPLVGQAKPAPARRWIVGRECNLACDGCRRAELEPGALPDDATVVVSGGEPTLSPRWLGSVRGRPWELETNGTLLYEARNVARLRAAGVRRVRLFLPGPDDAST